MGLEWQAAFGIVVGLYFYSHYFFASGQSCPLHLSLGLCAAVDAHA